MMNGWIVPPPKEPIKTRQDFQKEREEKVQWLIEEGYIHSERIKQALMKVPREDFIPLHHRDYAYLEVPLPLPGEHATISCPHSYPLFYEPLELDEGHRMLEIGSGSGYGAAVAREVVGPSGLVVTIEIDPVTHEFAESNLIRLGYGDVTAVLGDGGSGYPALAPYDRICFTAACREVPAPLIDQLAPGGKLIGPVLEEGIQYLTLCSKQEGEVIRQRICPVLYVSLRGEYGEQT